MTLVERKLSVVSSISSPEIDFNNYFQRQERYALEQCDHLIQDDCDAPRGRSDAQQLTGRANAIPETADSDLSCRKIAPRHPA